MSLSNLFVTTIVLAVATKAAPQLPPDQPIYFCPIVDSSASEKAISVTETHTEGITWTIGSDLGISAGELSLGGSWSVAETVSESIGVGAAPPCPNGQWRCSIIVTPSVVHVKGHMKKIGMEGGCKDQPVPAWNGDMEGKEFEYNIPIKDEKGNAKVSIDLCTCKDREHWADPGHPKDLCPEDCGGSK